MVLPPSRKNWTSRERALTLPRGRTRRRVRLLAVEKLAEKAGHGHEGLVLDVLVWEDDEGVDASSDRGARSRGVIMIPSLGASGAGP